MAPAIAGAYHPPPPILPAVRARGSVGVQAREEEGVSEPPAQKAKSGPPGDLRRAVYRHGAPQDSDFDMDELERFQLEETRRRSRMETGPPEAETGSSSSASH